MKEPLTEAAMDLILLSIGSEVSTQDEMLREKVQEILDRKIRYFESAIRDAHSQCLIVTPDAKAKAKGHLPVTRGHWRKPAFTTTWNRCGNSNIWLAIFSGSLKALLRADPNHFFSQL